MALRRGVGHYVGIADQAAGLTMMIRIQRPYEIKNGSCRLPSAAAPRQGQTRDTDYDLAHDHLQIYATVAEHRT